LDASRNAIAFKLTSIVLLLSWSVAAFPQTVTRPNSDLAEAKRLADEGKWETLLGRFPVSPDTPAEIQLYQGIALGRLGRLEQAERVLRAGAAKDPRDPRFPIELAGVEYKQGRFSNAKAELALALSITPEDPYANDFLATIYFLQGNTEAALKYWNRLGKPLLMNLSYEPVPRVKPVLLDRAFRFRLGQEWTVNDYLAARARIHNLEIFRNDQYDLQADRHGHFDLVFRAREYNGWGDSTAAGLLSLFRGLPVLTVTPEFSNLGRAAANWNSLFRWNDQQRRVSSDFSMPMGSDPAWRFQVYVDARNENWNISKTILTPAAALTGLNLERIQIGAEIRNVPSGTWSWSNTAIYSYRRYRSLVAIPVAAARFFENGSALHDEIALSRSLYRLPERRLTIDGGTSLRFGTHFNSSLGADSRLRGFLSLHWLPRPTGDDIEVEALAQAGHTFGDVSFDELSVLGFDRDNDLWLRGHDNAYRGQKGNAPFGRNYLLFNFDYMTKIFRNRFVFLRAGPILDSGRITDPSGIFGARQWLWDAGVEVRVRVLGTVEFTVGYGHGLVDNTNNWYTTQAGFANFRRPD
jgi:tetratricopeptide (TPR) repeat protein